MADAYLRHIAEFVLVHQDYYTLGDATLAFCGYFGSVFLVVVLFCC